MKYNELPKWAQRQAYKAIEKHLLQTDQEAREAGESVPYYTAEELNEVVMSHLQDIDWFEIECDEFGENPVLNW